MQATIHFGKHKGKSIEKILVEEPFYFAWLKEEVNKGNITDEKIKIRVYEISCKLNKPLLLSGKNALTVKYCKCGKRANYFGMFCERDPTTKIIFDVNLGDRNNPYLYCSYDCFPHRDVAEIYPATLNAILSLYATKEVEQKLIRFLLEVKGFEIGERINYNKLSKFLNQLSVEGCPQQLRLF